RFPRRLLGIRTAGSADRRTAASRRTRGRTNPDAGADRRLLFSFRHRRAHGSTRLDRPVGWNLGGKYRGPDSRADLSAAHRDHSQTESRLGLARYIVPAFAAGAPPRSRCRANSRLQWRAWWRTQR